MTLLSDNRLNNAVKILAVCTVLILAGICFAVYKADFSSFAVFIAFFVFYVQLPGLFVLRMLRIRFDHISTTLCGGIFAGWALEVAGYFITELIGTNILLYAAGPVCSLLFIIAKYMNRECDPKIHFSFSKLSTALCIFIVLGFLYALLNTQYLYLSPDVSDFTYINPDKGYHLGLIDSLSHGWPLESPWVQGRTIHYHIFTELLYSIPLRLFGVPADVLLLTCGPFMTVYIFGLSLYSLFREMSLRNHRAGLYCLALMLSNIFIAKGPHNSLAFFFIFRNENAVAYGISCMFMFIVLFKYWYARFKNGEKSINALILLVVVTMLLTGIKGPMALVMIGSVWGTYVIGILIRKVPLKTIFPILLMTVGFLIIYVTILGSKGQSNAGGSSIFAFATIASVTFYKYPLVAFLKGIGIPKVIRLGVLLTVFMVFTLTAFILPFAAGYIRELVLVFSGRKDYEFTRILVYAACLVGFAAMFVMNYSGHSQVYFGYAAILLVPLVSFWFFEDLEDNKGLLMNIVRGIFVACLIITSCTLAAQYKVMIEDAALFADDTIDYSRYECMTSDEYKAMIWIRDNTPEDSLLATDRYYSDSLETYSYKDRWVNRFFLYADYSNRFCYIAGSGYNLPADDWRIRRDMIEINDMLYDPNNDDRGRLARNLGVDYIVVSKDFTVIPSLENKDYDLCFTNDSIDIYEVKGGNN